MTDIYLGQNERSGRRRSVLFGLSLLLLIVAAAWYGLHAQRAAAARAAAELAAHPPTPPPAAVQDTATPLIREAAQLASQDQLSEARDKALEALDAATTDTARRRAEELLDKADIDLVTTPRPMKEKTEYVVAAGDSVDKIAKKFGTTVDLIRLSNGISGSIIRPGQRLRILTGTFGIKIDKSDNTLTVFLDGRYFKRYSVGTGQYNKTPVGTFKITDRIAQPTWWRPDGKSIPYGDPENLLGTHWLAIDSPGYGIHGTWQPETIGKQSSAGCVRLLNEDIEQLYTLLPLGTPVIIED